jgi:hypothetical protein
MVVVFSAVEERDLRSRYSDACSVRLGRWTAIVMCMGRELRRQASLLRLPVRWSRWAGNAARRAAWWLCLAGVEARGRGRVMRMRGRGVVSMTGAAMRRVVVSGWMCNGEMKEKLSSSCFALVNLVRLGSVGWEVVRSRAHASRRPKPHDQGRLARLSCGERGDDELLLLGGAAGGDEHTRTHKTQQLAGCSRCGSRQGACGDTGRQARQARPLTFHPRRFEDEDEVRASEYLLRGSATRGGVEEGGKCDVIADAGGGVHMPRL